MYVSLLYILCSTSDSVLYVVCGEPRPTAAGGAWRVITFRADDCFSFWREVWRIGFIVTGDLSQPFVQ